MGWFDGMGELIAAFLYGQLEQSDAILETRLALYGRYCEAFADLGVPPLNPETDRAMICGNLAFNLDLKELFEETYGLEEGANSKPAHFVVEKAFLD